MVRFVPTAASQRLLRAIFVIASIAGLSGCVLESTYNRMERQQEAIETALRAEISADQVEITELENGLQVRLSNDLLFREGSVELSEQGRAALAKVAPQLAAQADQIDVVGNTDNLPIGARLAERYPTNWELAAARATVVVRQLQHLGVDPSAMRAISAGQYHPAASNDSADGRARNRRTDILLRPQ